MARKYIDCREYPSDTNCSLYLSGQEDEVLKAAADHAVAVHGEKNDSTLREKLKKALKNENQTQEWAA